MINVSAVNIKALKKENILLIILKQNKTKQTQVFLRILCV